MYVKNTKKDKKKIKLKKILSTYQPKIQRPTQNEKVTYEDGYLVIGK